MRIEILGPQEVRILDNNGHDITSKLHICSITVKLESGKLPTALLECEISNLFAELQPDKVIATLRELGVKIEEKKK